MKLLISHYQIELNSLDQEILLLQTSNENIRDHTLFTKRVQEIKDYITRITKDIIYKKQNKLSKDRLAFTEGFAYHWHNATQNKGSRNYRRGTRTNINERATDEDTESDSSFTSSSSLPRQAQKNTTNIHNNLGARKRDYGGGHYTPSSKKRLPNSDTHLLPHLQKQGHITLQNERPLAQPKYLSATALQAIQILNTQAGAD